MGIVDVNRTIQMSLTLFAEEHCVNIEGENDKNRILYLKKTPTTQGKSVIKYLGSKRTLLPDIEQAIQGVGEVRSVIDLFSGTVVLVTI